jgi:acyl-CoA thioesterase
MNFRSMLINAFRKYPPIVKTFGMELSFDEDGCAIITLPYNPKLDHGEGATHGGAIATILDNAGYFTSALAVNEMVITSEMSFHLLRQSKRKKLVAKGKILKIGKKQVVAEMNCKDEDGTLIAHGTGTFLVLEQKKILLERKFDKKDF